jgi:hypothetical protein
MREDKILCQPMIRAYLWAQMDVREIAFFLWVELHSLSVTIDVGLDKTEIAALLCLEHKDVASQ